MGRRVLVVDDSAELLAVYSEILKDEGFHIETAESGEVAMAVASTFRPELVITDVNMPGMSGLELIHYFRTQYPAPAPALLAVSGFELAKQEAEQSGVTAFLRKPVGMEELVAQVHAALEGTPVARPERYERARVEQRAMSRAVAMQAGAALLRTQPSLSRRAELLVRHVADYFGGDAFLVAPREDGLFITFTSAPDRFPKDARAEGPLSITEDVLESGSNILMRGGLTHPLYKGETGLLPALGFLACVRCLFQEIPVGALCLTSPRDLPFQGNDLGILELFAGSLRGEADTAAIAKPLLSSSGYFSRATLRSILQLELESTYKNHESLGLVAIDIGHEDAIQDASRAELVRQLNRPRTLVAQMRPTLIALGYRGPAEYVRGTTLESLEAFGRAGALRAGARLLFDAPSSTHSAAGLIDWLRAVLAAALDGPHGTVLTLSCELEATPIHATRADRRTPPPSAPPPH